MYGRSITNDDVAKGDKFYAGQHMDGKWYRVKVNASIDEGTVAAKIVDFGDFTMIPLESLQPLWPQFRNLPMQAISASLAGRLFETIRYLEIIDTVRFGPGQSGLFRSIPRGRELSVAAKIIESGDFHQDPHEKFATHSVQFYFAHKYFYFMRLLTIFFSDIVGKNGDWTTEDTIWFSERVLFKNQIVSSVFEYPFCTILFCS